MDALAKLRDKLAKLGFEFAFDNQKELAASLDAIKRENDVHVNRIVRGSATRCMNQAVYFCAADVDLPEFEHYGLCIPIYTHFTSPIRRYADVLVHRLLAASLDIDSLPEFMTDRRAMNK